MKYCRILFSFTAICLLSLNILFGQDQPDWIDADIRILQYPSSKYLLGYASGTPLGNENVAQATDRIKNAAQSDLLENIRVNMKSNTQSFISSENINGTYTENEQFYNQTSKNSVAEVVGMKTESYYDKKSKTVYAFVYANRKEVVEYHKKALQFNLSQAESILNAAQELFSQNDRATARDKCSEALSFFEKINESQMLLITIGNDISKNDLQQKRTSTLYKSIVELQSQLDPKYETFDYLKNELSQKLIQVESVLNTINELVNTGEKAKAKQQCELAQNIIEDIHRIQDSLLLIEPTVSIETLELQRTEKIHNDIKLLSAQLTQGILVFIDSSEDVFGKQESVVANKLKSQMALNGCSFTDEVSKADFVLTLMSETRESTVVNNLFFCYADVSIELYDTHKQKVVYGDDISEKGGSTTKEKAARKAMENAADIVMNSILKWIK